MSEPPLNDSSDPEASEAPDSDATQFTDEMLAQLRIVIPGYTLLRGIGNGGQGRVYKAVRDSDGLAVAIKVLHLGPFASDDARRRLKREITALTVLHHPGIVRIIESGQTADGNDFLVTEFIDALRLDEYARQALEAGDVRERVLLFAKVCDAVDAAHRSGIVHRDLSPSNVLVDRRGQPHVVDFGLARSAFDAVIEPRHSATGFGWFLGRMEYASPEQLRGGANEIAQPSDVYSLGVMLYELLSGGERPYLASGDRMELAARITTESILPLARPAGLADAVRWEALTGIVKTALSKRPADRFQSAGEMRRRLCGWLDEDGTVASPGVPDTSLRPTAPMHTSPIDAVKFRRDGNDNAGVPHDQEGRMNITNAQERAGLIQWAMKVREIVRERGDDVGVRRIEAAVERLREDRFTLAIMGKAKRGKSTLINALLGRTDDLVAPIDRLPASSTITRVRYAAEESVEVVFQDGRRESISLAAIRDYVTEEHNPENRKGVMAVRVAGPFAGLDTDLELVDTPGAGSMHAHHDAILHGFIPEADAVVFLVTARMPLAADELDLLRRLRAADVRKVFFVINRIDESTERDIADAAAHNLRLLAETGLSISELHRVSAKRAYTGDWTGSGVPLLAETLRAFLAQNKGRVLRERFEAEVVSAAGPSMAGLDVAIAGASKNMEELERDLSRLRARKAAIEQDRKFAEREFLTAWNQAADRFDAGIREAAGEVERTVLGKLSDCSLLGVSGFAKELPSLLNRCIEEETAPHSRRFELAASEACERLRTDYPAVGLGIGGAVSIRCRAGNQVVVAAVGGAAAAATGVSLAAVGTATAASIAAANAAAAAMTATVTVPTVAGSALGWLGSTIGGWLFGSSGAAAGASLIGGLGTGTATVAAPGAMTVAPMWVALAGPVGWTLAGVGVLAIPLAWRASKSKQKDRLEEMTRQQIRAIFAKIESDRLPTLRKMARSIAEEISLSLDRDLDQVEMALVEAVERRPDARQVEALTRQAERLRTLVSSPLPGTGSIG